MKIAYGNRFLEIRLPPGWFFDRIEPARTDVPPAPLRERIEEALDTPVDFLPPEKYLRGKPTVLLVVPDGTRPCPLPEILPVVVEWVQRVSGGSLLIAVANGVHAPMPAEALRQHIGAQLFDRWQVIQHDAYSKDMVEVGETRRGTRVAVNPVLLRVEAILAIGPVQHHYFAGFGGGPKLIVPGLAAAETALQNHRLAVAQSGRLCAECREGIIDGNPVAEDIDEAVSLCPPVFHLGFILDEKGQVTDALAGGLQTTHRTLAQRYHRTHLRVVKERRGFVVASAGGAPRDCDLIQGHKGLHRAFRLVAPGGTLVYFAQCEAGIGSQTFLPWFQFSTRTEMARELRDNYTLNGHTALALKEKMEKARIVLVSDLPDDVVSKMGMIPVRPGEVNLLDLSKLVSGEPEAKGWVLPEAAEVLPLPYDELRPEDTYV